MKTIILAAGMGTRLGKYTENLPKCLLPFHGKTLLERQIEVLRSCGIDDIVVVKGYAGEKITLRGVKYYENPEFATTNMVATLMSAQSELTGECLVAYGDIIYEPRLIKTILASKAQIAVLADETWHAYWQARMDDWHQDVESLQYDQEGQIYEIGTPRCTVEQAHARYIGILKFLPQGMDALKKVYHENKKRLWNQDTPWMKSKSFRKAYMTCMLQKLIDEGVEVKVVCVQHGWLEFDTVEDYERANLWLSENSLIRFIHLD